MAVILTGRSTRFEARVKDICQGAQLPFREFHTKPLDFDGSVFEFKRDVLQDLVARYRPSKISMWEDRPPHVRHFRQFLAELEHSRRLVSWEVHPVFGGPYLIPEPQERAVVRVLNTNSGSPLNEQQLGMTVVRLSLTSSRRINKDQLEKWISRHLKPSVQVVEVYAKEGRPACITVRDWKDACTVHSALDTRVVAAINKHEVLYCDFMDHPVRSLLYRKRRLQLLVLPMALCCVAWLQHVRRRP